MDILSFGREARRNRELKPYYVLKNKDIDRIEILLSNDRNMRRVLNSTGSPSKFYNIYTDLKYTFEKDSRVEMYYAMRNGFYIEGIPSYITYVVTTVYSLYGTVNMIPASFSSKQVEELVNIESFGKHNSLQSATDAILGENHEYLSLGRNKVRNGDLFDIYIKDTDRVAIINKDLASKLNSETIDSIKYVEGALRLGSRRIATLVSKLGVTASVYDLSTII